MLLVIVAYSDDTKWTLASAVGGRGEFDLFLVFLKAHELYVNIKGRSISYGDQLSL
jgi:hypothetical protein